MTSSFSAYKLPAYAVVLCVDITDDIADDAKHTDGLDTLDELTRIGSSGVVVTDNLNDHLCTMLLRDSPDKQQLFTPPYANMKGGPMAVYPPRFGALRFTFVTSDPTLHATMKVHQLVHTAQRLDDNATTASYTRTIDEFLHTNDNNDADDERKRGDVLMVHCSVPSLVEANEWIGACKHRLTPDAYLMVLLGPVQQWREFHSSPVGVALPPHISSLLPTQSYTLAATTTSAVGYVILHYHHNTTRAEKRERFSIEYIRRHSSNGVLHASQVFAELAFVLGVKSKYGA